MNIDQVAAKKPRIYAISVSQTQLCPSIHFKPRLLLMDFDPLSVISKKNLGTKPSCVLQCQPILKSRQSPHVCLAGGRGSMNNNEDSQMKSLEKGLEQLNGQSIEDILRQQMLKGGTGCKPPGGRGDVNSPSGSEDGGSGGMNETLQVVLATISFICLYIIFIDGLELAKLAKDYIKFLSGGRQSVRLKRFKYNWSQFYRMGWRKPPHGCSSC